MGWSGEMGRSVYEQPGNEVDRILSQQGWFQVSKRERKGAKGMRKGETESKGIAHKYIARLIFMYIVYACKCLNDCQSIYVYIIMSDMNAIDNLNCV